MEEATPALATALCAGLAVLLSLAVTVAALGPRSLEEARAGWRSLRPRRPDEARAEIGRIAAMRRDPELANMYFLSRFLVMVVQEAVGQMLAGILAALPATEGVHDKIVEAPFAIASLWLALICLLVYRRIAGFDRWSATLAARAGIAPPDPQGA